MGRRQGECGCLSSDSDNDHRLGVRAAAAVVQRRALTASMLRARLCRLRSCLVMTAREDATPPVIASTSDDMRHRAMLSCSTAVVVARYDALSEVLQLSALIASVRRTLTATVNVQNMSQSVSQQHIYQKDHTLKHNAAQRNLTDKRNGTHVNRNDWIYDLSMQIPRDVAEAPVTSTLRRIYHATVRNTNSYTNGQQQEAVNASGSSGSTGGTGEVLVDADRAVFERSSADSVFRSEHHMAVSQSGDEHAVPTPTHVVDGSYQRRTFYRSAVIDERRAPNAPWHSYTSVPYLAHDISKLEDAATGANGAEVRDIPETSCNSVAVTHLPASEQLDCIHPQAYQRQQQQQQERIQHAQKQAHMGYGMFRVEAVQAYIGQRRLPAEPLVRDIIEVSGRQKSGEGMSVGEVAQRMTFFQADAQALQFIRLKDFVFEIGADGRIRHQRQIVQ